MKSTPNPWHSENSIASHIRFLILRKNWMRKKKNASQSAGCFQILHLSGIMFFGCHENCMMSWRCLENNDGLAHGKVTGSTESPLEMSLVRCCLWKRSLTYSHPAYSTNGTVSTRSFHIPLYMHHPISHVCKHPSKFCKNMCIINCTENSSFIHLQACENTEVLLYGTVLSYSKQQYILYTCTFTPCTFYMCFVGAKFLNEFTVTWNTFYLNSATTHKLLLPGSVWI